MFHLKNEFKSSQKFVKKLLTSHILTSIIIITTFTKLIFFMECKKFKNHPLENWICLPTVEYYLLDIRNSESTN